MAQSKKRVPEAHNGVFYHNFMAELSDKRGTLRYLEIGVSAGVLLSQIKTRHAVGVDPIYAISANIAERKSSVTLFQTTSDSFFSTPEMVAAIGGAPDLSFLDGLHTFDCLLRDFMNTEAISHPNSLIVMHDCLPLDDVMTIRDLNEWAGVMGGTRYEHWWTGDVWKIIPILQMHRPDLVIYYVDCPPTGLVCITNLTPKNSVLRDRYLDIVAQFRASPNDMQALQSLYQSIEFTSSKKILKEFDHNTYFRI